MEGKKKHRKGVVVAPRIVRTSLTEGITRAAPKLVAETTVRMNYLKSYL